MAYQIRHASRDDAAQLARLRYDFRSNLSAPIEDESDFIERCQSWMTTRLGDGRWHCWVAEDGDRLIGNVWIQLVEKIPTPTDEPEEHAYLTNFFVLEAARGRGIGSDLLSWVLEWSARRQVHAVFLWPTTRTRAMYERHGFLADGDAMQLLFVPRAQ
jgi:GNAT superfamily N-acetyltransferase